MIIPSCTGKHKHGTYTEAERQLQKQRRRKALHDKQSRGVRVKVYRCEHCRSWHIGSTWERVFAFH